jgi:hypothetical protein
MSLSLKKLKNHTSMFANSHYNPIVLISTIVGMFYWINFVIAWYFGLLYGYYYFVS